MGKRCVAYDCKNIPDENISCFIFPKDPTLRATWIAQVKRTRADWEGPSAQSVFCCKHFTKDCFEKDTEYAARFSKKCHRLVQGAIPTIFKRPHRETSSQSLEGCCLLS